MISNYKIQGSDVSIEIVKEEPTIYYSGLVANYNLHFNFGIKNNSKDKILVKFFIDYSEEKVLKKQNIKLWSRNSNSEDYKLFEIEGETNLKGSYVFMLELNIVLIFQD